MGFDDIIGQDTLLAALNRAIGRKEVGHAYLFSGPEGSGKKTVASLFARSLNCSSEERPCGICLSCRKIQNNNHPDMYELKPESTWLKIGQLKGIKDNLYLLPVEGKKKVCTIHSADHLTLTAANSLLKILEEPPQDVVFLLLSSRPWALLSTVISRCIHFPIKPLSIEEMNKLLATRFDLSPEEKEITSVLAGGNPGKGIEIATSGKWFQKYKQTLHLVKEIEEGSLENIVLKAEELSNSNEVDETLDLMLLIYRDRLVLNRGGKENNVMIKTLLESNSKGNSNIEHFSELKKDPFFLEKMCRLMMEVRHHVNINNINMRLALEEVFLRMRGVV